MSNVSITDLSDVVLVGGAGHGADFLQNMYGMYVAKDQMYSGEASNIEVSAEAYKFLYKPVVATSLLHTAAKDNISKEGIADLPTSHTFLIRRDWKDAMVQTWKSFAPESTWDEFKESSLGLPLIRDFEGAISDMVFTKTISYEHLVTEPQQQLSEFIFDVLPQQDNAQHHRSFGKKKRHVNFDIIDLVVQDSLVRDLREGVDGSYLESVGVHKVHLTEEQSAEIDEFVSGL
jgi:hypothetical protein